MLELTGREAEQRVRRAQRGAERDELLASARGARVVVPRPRRHRGRRRGRRRPRRPARGAARRRDARTPAQGPSAPARSSARRGGRPRNCSSRCRSRSRRCSSACAASWPGAGAHRRLTAPCGGIRQWRRFALPGYRAGRNTAWVGLPLGSAMLRIDVTAGSGGAQPPSFVAGKMILAAVPSIGRADRVDRAAAPEADATRALYEQLREPDLPLLPAPARLARGGRGRSSEHVPECVPWASSAASCRSSRRPGSSRSRTMSACRAADRVAPGPDRVPGRLRRGRGAGARAVASSRRADRPAGRPRDRCRRTSAARSSCGNGRVSRTARSQRRARALAGCRRDADLPRAPLARTAVSSSRRSSKQRARAARALDWSNVLAGLKSLLFGGAPRRRSLRPSPLSARRPSSSGARAAAAPPPRSRRARRLGGRFGPAGRQRRSCPRRPPYLRAGRAPRRSTATRLRSPRVSARRRLHRGRNRSADGDAAARRHRTRSPPTSRRRSPGAAPPTPRAPAGLGGAVLRRSPDAGDGRVAATQTTVATWPRAPRGDQVLARQESTTLEPAGLRSRRPDPARARRTPTTTVSRCSPEDGPPVANTDASSPPASTPPSRTAQPNLTGEAARKRRRREQQRLERLGAACRRPAVDRDRAAVTRRTASSSPSSSCSRWSASDSSWRTRSRVRPSSLPIVSSEADSPPNPKRSSMIRRCRSGRSATARWMRWRRTASTASSAGSTDDSSANRSPSSESPSEPRPWFSEIESTASSASTDVLRLEARRLARARRSWPRGRASPEAPPRRGSA